MKIVHVLTRLHRAGSEENTLINCRAQVTAGHEVHLIYGSEASKDVCARAKKSNVILHQLNSLRHQISVWQDVCAVYKIAKLCRQIRPDIVHTHQSKAGILGRIAARLAGVPVVLHGIHIAPFYSVGVLRRIFYLVAERCAGFFTDGYISVSKAMRDVYVSNNIGRADQHFVIHSGMDLQRFRNAQPTGKLANIFPDKNHNILVRQTLLMVSAFEPRKKQIDLIFGFRALLENVPDARLVFLGDGQCIAGAKHLVQELNMQKSVYFAGYRNDPERWIAAADVGVLLSQREGLPRVVIQYLAAGKPVLCSDLPGISELVKDGENGVVVPAHTPELLKEGMARMLDLENYPRFRQAAQDVNLDAWHHDQMCRNTLEVYQHFLECRSSASAELQNRVL